MKLKQKMFMKIFMKTKVYLILVIIQKIQSFFYLVNKIVIGKMKDEFKKKIIRDFVGLKSKLCSLVIEDNEKIKKAKGVNKSIIKNKRHREYIDVLFNKKMTRHKIKEFKVNYMKLKLGMFIKFLCLVLMIKDMY